MKVQLRNSIIDVKLKKFRNLRIILKIAINFVLKTSMMIKVICTILVIPNF